MGVPITSMTDGAPVVGTEIIPTSKAGAPRRVTTANVKDYVVDSIEAVSAGSAPTGADSLFALQGGVLKPIDIDLVTQYVVNTIWAEAAEASPAGADTLPLYDASEGAENTITLTVLAEFVRSTIQAAILDVSDLSDGSGTIATSDYMLVTQGTTGKRIQISDLSTLIYTSLATHVTGKTGSGAGDAADVLYLVRGSTPYKITLAQIATYVGTTAAITGSGTADRIAMWSSSSALSAGASVIPVATGFNGAGSDSAVPTTAAVRGEMETIIYDATDIGGALADADTILVDDGAAGTTQRKSALSRVWTWIQSKLTIADLDIDGATDIGAALADADLLIVDDGAGGTNRKSAMSRVYTYILAKLATAPVGLMSYTVAGVPAATTAGQLIYVSNETGGAVVAFSDGTNWRRVTDRAIVS